MDFDKLKRPVEIAGYTVRLRGSDMSTLRQLVERLKTEIDKSSADNQHKLNDRMASRDFAKVFAEMLVDSGTFRTCLNCDHWNMASATQQEGCRLVQGRLPPAKVIVMGCEKHSECIPF